MNPKEAMLDLLTALKAVYLSHWAAHWRVKGTTSYGDHLLFERLYTAMPEQIDTLAEKIVAMHGPEALVDGEDTAAVAESLKVFDSEPNLYKRALMLEDSLQNLIQSVMSDLEDAEELTPGLDDYLAALANSHETHQYLLSYPPHIPTPILGQPCFRLLQPQWRAWCLAWRCAFVESSDRRVSVMHLE